MTDINYKGYFIALTGAKKNVGDFLITERALNLLNINLPNYKLKLLSHWEELPDIETVNNSQGIIILGGPGFQMDMYPGVYKLVSNLELIKVPIFTLGVGWKGVPGDRTTERLYEFTYQTKKLMDIMDKSLAGMSCRDLPTHRVLSYNGYNNVTMTGCPVWYDLNSIGKKLSKPEKIRKLVYTPAQSKFYSHQTIEVLKFLKVKYKDAQIFVSFHRGLGEVDEYTSKDDAANTMKIVQAAQIIGVKIVDVSYDTSRLSFYDDCDLHIGYRVHAHIYFLSKRLPSILLHEDGRGNGVTQTLKSPGVIGYKSSMLYQLIFGFFNKNRRLLGLYKKLSMRSNPRIIEDLDELIDSIERSDYNIYENIFNFIDNHYRVMQKYIKSMAIDDLEA